MRSIVLVSYMPLAHSGLTKSGTPLALKKASIATTSGRHHRNKFLGIQRTRPLQRCSSPRTPQLKPSSNRFEPTAQSRRIHI